MTMIRVDCTAKEILQIEKILGKHRIKLDGLGNINLNLEKRRNKVYNHLEEGISVEKAYRKIRKTGFKFRRKTYTRDLNGLEERNLIRIDIIFNKGRTSKITILRGVL